MTRRVLIAATTADQEWVSGAAAAFRGQGFQVDLVQQVEPPAEAVEAIRAAGLTRRDLVVAQGRDLCLEIARAPGLTAPLWVMPQDDQAGRLGIDADLQPTLTELSPSIDRLLVTHPDDLGWAEGIQPTLIGRTLQWPDDGTADSLIPRALGDADARVSTAARTRVLLCGRDFKFATGLMRHLASRDDLEFRVDHHVYNSPPAEVDELADWAEIIICEFAQEHAVWHSRNVRPGQRLIVRLHGYELFTGYADDLEVDNCEAIVFVSGHQRQLAEEKGWPADRLHVIGNAIDVADFARPKIGSPQFELGLVGMAPALKRPDRAVDLLRILLHQDPRYRLRIRGHAPWTYLWEWRTPLHREVYLHLFEQLAADERLRSAVVFEGFGPAIANFYRKVGWVLSPSYRESFHLAPIEGMAGGAVPVVWDRQGARDIFSERWTHASTEAAAEFILRTNASDGAYADESRAAGEFVRRYDQSAAAAAWDSLIDRNPRFLKLPPLTESATGSFTETPVQPVVRVVVGEGTRADVAATLDSLTLQTLHPGLMEVTVAEPGHWSDAYPIVTATTSAATVVRLPAGTTLEPNHLLAIVGWGPSESAPTP